jgi:hypothetical protein
LPGCAELAVVIVGTDAHRQVFPQRSVQREDPVEGAMGRCTTLESADERLVNARELLERDLGEMHTMTSCA